MFVEFDALFGGESLGLLFGVAGSGGDDGFADVSGDGEGFVVVGAVFFEGAVNWGFEFVFLGEFLEVGLGVAPRFFFEDFVDFGEDVFVDEIFGGVVALVEVDGADDGFEAVGDDDGVGAVDTLLLAVGEANEGFVAELVAGVRDGLGANESGAPSGHDAFGFFVVAEEEVASDEFEDGVAEVFETLVVFEVRLFMLVDVTAVSEGDNEEIDVVKFEAEFFFGKTLIGF